MIDIILKKIKSNLDSNLQLDDSTYRGVRHKVKLIDKDYGEFWRIAGDICKGTTVIHPQRAKDIKRKQQIEKIKKLLPTNITLVENSFVSISKPAKFIHDEYGVWSAVPFNVINGLSKKPRNFITLDYIKKKLPDFITIQEDTFISSNKPAMFIDSDFGEYTAKPYRVLEGALHKRRAMQKVGQIRQRSIESVVAMLPSHITIKPDTYSGMHKPAIFVDKDYGEFTALPKNVLYNGLNHKRRFGSRSKTEDAIAEFIKSIGIDVLQNYRFDGPNSHEVDIFIPSCNLGIEYNGLYWHSEEYKEKYYHYNKRYLFNKYGITLYQVYSDEWEQRPEIIKSMILAKLSCLTNRYFARNLILRGVLSKEAQEFLIENHLMGEYKTAKYLGLYTKDNELVSLIGYKKHKDGIDISRFCNKLDTAVVGGLSKLLKEVERLNPESKYIQSWVDLRYGTGNSLLKLGFKHVKTTLGWKWTDGINTYNRLRCRANMDKRKLTEREYANELGWYRIYDAGQALFVKDVVPNRQS